MGTSERYEFVVGDDPNPSRLDAWLAQIPDLTAAGLSRSRLQALAADGLITVNGTVARAAQRVRPLDTVTVWVPPARSPADLVPQDIPVSAVYEDEHLIVVDKPAGLPVHPGPGHPDGTLVNALLARCPDIRGIGGQLRPGIVHRLDLDTSGLMVVAKTQRAHQCLTEQLKNREFRKEYLAVAVGMVTPESGTIDAPIARDPRHRQKMAVDAGGRAARTHYETLEELEGHTLLNLVLETGRTHQIRVHLAYLGYPLLGDAVYGKASALTSRQFLHAARLGFLHPITGDWMQHSSDIPGDVSPVLDTLRARSAKNH
ncbi:MAG: RluA family pseudouridine synthase [Chloroflexota bacterium]|nr:RluA family pseudouridine synthase [Chloroflexota bacterium]MDE2959869.1 RluA family pseudouridine synthase [Chloroflexota bacterium]